MAGDVFGKFRSSVNRGIATISVKTSSSLEKSKIKTHIDTLSKEIERDFTSVGEAAYQKWTTGETDFSDLSEQFQTIANKRQTVQELTEQLNSIDQRDDQILGSHTQQSKESAPKYVFCINCGAQCESSTNFCRKCGHKIVE